MSTRPGAVGQIRCVKPSGGTVFLGTAVVACGVWLAWYATAAFHRAAAHLGHVAVQLKPEALRRYAGDYELGGEIFVLTVRDGRLFAATQDHPEMPEQELLAASETQFFLRDTDGDFVAMQDRHGRISGFRFTHDDQSREVRKVR